MKKRLVITDLTRMQEGRVCVAGYDPGVQCVRPVLPPPGILEYMLGLPGKPIVFPGAEVELDLGEPTPSPPHTEDVPFAPHSVTFVRRLPDSAWRDLLQATTRESVEAVFGQPIHREPGHYVMDGSGPRSLGTLRPRDVLGGTYESKDGTARYRLGFVDGSGTVYWLAVTDLAWRYYIDRQGECGRAPEQIARDLLGILQERDVFLRLGLARGWEKHPGLCSVQITGVHTFPDYLKGRTFADFAPRVDGSSASSSPLALFGLALLPDDDPATWNSRLRTGLVLLAAEYGGPDAGLAVLEQLFPDGQGTAGLTERDLWARLLVRAGRIPEALACAELRRQTRDSYLPRMIMLQAHVAAGDIEAAAEDAHGIESITEQQSVAPALARGHLAIARGSPTEAEHAFREALAQRPDHPEALSGLAGALARTGDAAGAAALLRDAVEIGGAEARPALLRGLADLCPEEREWAESAIHAAIGKLAERVRAQLAEARSARRTVSGRAEADKSRADAVRVAAVPGADMLARLAVDANEIPPEYLTGVLYEHFGHGSFRTGQAAVLRSVLSDGKDTLAIMPTGAGKSLCFQLPALVLPGVVLVVSPIVALMADQVAGLADIPALAERACVINSTLPAAELETRYRRLAAGDYSLVYVAPERLRQARLVHALKRAGISLLVIDEAHCLSLWGHAFRPDYLAIGQVAELLGKPRILAVTATATADMQAEIAHTLGRPLAVVNTGVLRDNLFLEVCKVANDREKRSRVLEFVRRAPGPGIIYAGSRDRCEHLAATLRRLGESAIHYHAGMTAAERESAQHAFMAGQVRVLVATIAFGLGVNKRDIRFIVHYQPSDSLEAYTQEAGRAGRDGRPAHCVLFATPSDKGTLTRRAREDHVQIDGLRELYRRVRRAVTESAGGPVEGRSLLYAGEESDRTETTTRVGLSVLERAGFVTRGLDVPREVTIMLSRDPRDRQANDLAAALHLQVGRQRSLRVDEAARDLGTSADLVEQLLLQCQDQGVLRYTTSRSSMQIVLTDPVPADAAGRLDEILATMDRAADARARALARYIDTAGCRNRVIARHFGVPAPAACGRCDVCEPKGRRAERRVPAQPAAPRVTGLSPRDAILHLVDELPFAAGRTGLSRILAGAGSSPIEPERCRLFGALTGQTQASITREIDALLREGLLAASYRDQRPCVVLTEQGRGHVER